MCLFAVGGNASFGMHVVSHIRRHSNANRTVSVIFYVIIIIHKNMENIFTIYCVNVDCVMLGYWMKRCEFRSGYMWYE